MSAIPGGIDTERQPPMTIPLRHFLVGLVFLLAGALLGLLTFVGLSPGTGYLAHVHLLLAGWVCLTIMGAMTQFVPVWSAVELHSRRLANVQLLLVSVGVAGLAVGFLTLRFEWLLASGLLAFAGFATFVYNVARTLGRTDELDVTERHFVLALAFFVVLGLLGVVLALNFVTAILSGTAITHGGVLGAHAAVAVFGAVLTTVYGALYQLGTMFTQTELHGVDNYLQRGEEIGHPLGVVLLAGGRLVDASLVASAGGVLIGVAALSVAFVLGRKLLEMRVDRTPMHTRYAVVTVAITLWAVVSIPSWLAEPTGRRALLAAPGTAYLLILGVIGFVVVGTLYHVVPFIVWVHSYSDKLGFEDVPMIDDLYSDRLAVVEGTFLLSGTTLLVAGASLSVPTAVSVAGGVALVGGALAFTTNMVLVVHRHGPQPLDEVLLGAISPRRSTGRTDETAATE